MKGVWISLCIVAIMVGGSVLYTKHIDKVSYELGEMNDRVMESLEDKEYDEAANEARKLAEYLAQKRTVLDATGNHEELNKIEMSVSEMTGYIEGEQCIDAISKCMVLDFMFSHLPRNYKLKLENIL